MSLLLALTASGGGAVNYTLSCATGAYAYAGNAASLKQAHSLVLAPGAYTLSGKAATLTVARRLALAPGAYAYTGQAATLTYSSGGVDYTLTCAAGEYAYAGSDAALSYAPGTGVSAKSGVNRLWLIDYYTKAFAAKEAALKPARTVKAKTAARKRAAEHEAEIESLVAKAEADIEVLTQGIKDAHAAQQFTYNLLTQVQSLPDMALEIDFLAIANGYRERVRREDDELLLLSMVL